ncbi:anaphase-promoting complex subunit 5-like isoform X2 [Amphiura filiformis]|uniref:anaphase-promoting complex subunit 5-like isoform X1 n=1 Tax=Amphiura filiformis TaxID=82378 RepID=UPI003B20F868
MELLYNQGFGGMTRPKEWITPHKVSMLILILEYAEKEKKKKGAASVTAEIGEGWDLKVSRKFCRAMLSWIQMPDVELLQLLPKVRDISEELCQILIKRLHGMVSTGISSLANFFQSLEQLLDSNNGEASLHRHSILGMFMRRMVLSYDKLSFSQVSKLYAILKLYVKEESGRLTEANRSEAMADISMVMDDGGTMTKEELEATLPECAEERPKELPAEKVFTRRQGEFFIAQQASLLEKDESKALPPDILQQQINALQESNPDLTETHYLSYLNCMRLSEFCGAIHNLHSYFDHLLPKGDNSKDNKDSNHNTAEQKTKSYRYRYAALGLAGLHCRFGHRENALHALKEAIKMAQEASDHVCLQHAMGWLYRLEDKEGIDISSLLDRSVAKTEELNLPYLTSLGIQSFTRHKALQSIQPAMVFEYLAKSDALNCQHNQSQLVSTSLAQQSALWQMYGQSTMSSLCDQLLLSMSSLEFSTVGHSRIDSEAMCLAVSNQARQLADQGRVQAAKDVLLFAETKFPKMSQHAKIWMLCKQQLLFQQAVNQARWQQAEQMVLSIAALSSIDSKFRNALLSRMKGETTQSLKLLHDVIDQCTNHKEGWSTEMHARALMLLAEVQCESSNHMTAIPHLFECLALCHKHHLTYLAAMATAHVAHIQLILKMPHHGMSLLKKIMPVILANGSVQDKSRVQLLLAKCQLACHTSKQDPEGRKTALLSAVQMLSQAAEGFHTVETEYRVKDVMYLQAHIYQELGYTSERNKCAMHFRQLDQQYPTALVPPMSTL